MELADSASKYGKEFQEIGHCGGQFTITVNTAEDGQRSYQFSITYSRPTAASCFAIYVLPPGLPVGTIQMGGIGDSYNPPPIAGCVSIYISSDSLGMFGHLCPQCKGYWRSIGVPSKWRMTCPYCGLRTDCHQFLTEGQRKYVEACSDLFQKAMQSEHDGEHTIDMDKVADAVGKDQEKPQLYYVEESQQNNYNCFACGDSNDILGRYGYCSCCGTHNGTSELEIDIEKIRDRIEKGQPYEACVKDTVSIFDSYARQIAKQLSARVPMTPARRKEWNKKLFHNLQPCADALKAVFDIKMLKGFQQNDIEFATLMFHRRHIYEHNGGEADEKYISDSGDTTVRPKQVIRESRKNALRIANLVLEMGKNIHKDFHDIFPPEEKPLQIQQRRDERKL